MNHSDPGVDVVNTKQDNTGRQSALSRSHRIFWVSENHRSKVSCHTSGDFGI